MKEISNQTLEMVGIRWSLETGFKFHRIDWKKELYIKVPNPVW